MNVPVALPRITDGETGSGGLERSRELLRISAQIPNKTTEFAFQEEAGFRTPSFFVGKILSHRKKNLLFCYI
jgi:hypothetical protein